jgi:pantoate--beta-alanine ligase
MRQNQLPHTASLPPLVTTTAELRAALQPARRAGRRIGLVPTMGALHAGHLSLVRASRAECDVTVVSIYVNPSQFGPGEDFSKYPRTLAGDLEKLAGCGADLVLAPGDAEVYAPGHATWVEVGAVAEPWEGRLRPGHFRGVATIVLKLFHMVQPDIAYFGQKDYQQTLVVRRMVADLDVPVAIRVCPTVREPDGLAMSSRNAYLSAEARRRATVIFKSLAAAQQAVAGGQRDAEALARQIRELLLSAGGVTIDYVALAHPETLEPVKTIVPPTLAAVAIRIDGTRLIDNCLLDGQTPAGKPAR